MLADVEGAIEEVDGVLRITRIKLRYRFKAPPPLIEQAREALADYAAGCPAYQSVKECMEITWLAEIREG